MKQDPNLKRIADMMAAEQQARTNAADGCITVVMMLFGIPAFIVILCWAGFCLDAHGRECGGVFIFVILCVVVIIGGWLLQAVLYVLTGRDPPTPWFIHLIFFVPKFFVTFFRFRRNRKRAKLRDDYKDFIS